jgi:hypothetical protein
MWMTVATQTAAPALPGPAPTYAVYETYSDATCTPSKLTERTAWRYNFCDAADTSSYLFECTATGGLRYKRCFGSKDCTTASNCVWTEYRGGGVRALADQKKLFSRNSNFSVCQSFSFLDPCFFFFFFVEMS